MHKNKNVFFPPDFLIAVFSSAQSFKMLFSILLFLLFKAELCLALPTSIQSVQPARPTSKSTALKTEFAPAWVSEPAGRGTWSLLYRCTFTLFLCIWTALHLNVSPEGESRWQSWLRSVKWVATALFAPEVVLYTACFQAYCAWDTCQTLNRFAQKQKDRTRILT